ncbi:tRNA pseudouridine(38-40) synthase TruA [Flectobacillus major]|uniref:tRNA pseudouridine(38-40) synthase TruA n=1 Tax=Flectobacillus major TaxID=103 RepID=UPI0004284605|nr:tRNA pseudouridine(38-40) synthase TruA [Flectobacillus major]
MRYFLECSYLGTNYCGWQVQHNALSVQEEIEKGLSTLLKTKIGISGSSRTDAGVHAYRQIAHFDRETPISDTHQLVYRLNKILPQDIVVKQIYQVPSDYHCRFEAISRKYEYRIIRKKSPFYQHIAYQFEMDLDIEKMNQAAQVLFNHIDFECFSKLHTDVKTFNCTILEAEWKQEKDDLWVFHIKANRFLRGMVRAIVGTLLEVGLGKLSVEGFEEVILQKNRQKAGRSVPAQGLFLMEVNYPN